MAEMTVSVKVVNFGSLKALASVTIDGMEIRGFKVIDSDVSTWVASPSREIVRDGRKEYYNIVRFEDQEKKRQFEEAVLEEYRRAVERA